MNTYFLLYCILRQSFVVYTNECTIEFYLIGIQLSFSVKSFNVDFTYFCIRKRSKIRLCTVNKL